MDAQTWLEENVTFENKPVTGSTFITPDGKFVNLNSIGFEHIDLVKKLEEYGIKTTEDELIPGLQDNGWIRCNSGIKGYAYIELRDIEPNNKQIISIKNFIDLVFKSINEITIIFLTKYNYEEEIYSSISTDQILLSIKNLYTTGKLVKF